MPSVRATTVAGTLTRAGIPAVVVERAAVERDLIAAVRSLDAANVGRGGSRARLGFPPGTAHRLPVAGAGSSALRGPGCVEGKDVESHSSPVDHFRAERGGRRRDDQRGGTGSRLIVVGRSGRGCRGCRWCHRGRWARCDRIRVRPDHRSDHQEHCGDRNTAHHSQARTQTLPQNVNPHLPCGEGRTQARGRRGGPVHMAIRTTDLNAQASTFLSTVEMTRGGPVKVHGDTLDQTGRYLLTGAARHSYVPWMSG